MNVDWIIFLAGALTLLIGFLVWLNNPRAKLNIFFGIFGLVTSIQIFLDFLFRFFPNLFVLRSTYAFAILISLAASFWIFEICNFRIGKFYRFLFFLPGLALFVITYLDGLIVKEIKGLSVLGYIGTLGPLFPVYTLVIALYSLIFIFLINLPLYIQRALYEEKKSLKKFGKSYIIYMKNVSFMFPINLLKISRIIKK